MAVSRVGVSLFALCLSLRLAPSFGAKNVLLMVVDDLRPSIGGYGDKNAYTPNMDRFMAEGIVFREAFAQFALCAPSRNSFLTGRRPDTLRLYDFYSYWRTSAGNFTTLPQYFKENSYETKSIGKIFHPGISSNFTDDYPLSWSHIPWHPQTEKYKNSPVCYAKNGWFANLFCPVNLEEQPQQTLPDIESAEEAIHFLRSKNDSRKPFFLAVGFHKPHIPLKFPWEFLDYHPIEGIALPKFRHRPPELPDVAWNPWTDLRERHDISQLNLTFPFQEMPDDWAKLIIQGYQASVSYVDSLVGKLLTCLETTSLSRNTVVALIGDHGWSLAEHGEWSKYSNFDVALRVPLVIRVPGVRHLRENPETNATSRNVVELVDLFPTLVDLAGLEPIPKCPKNSRQVALCAEGESLAPIVLRERSDTRTRPKDRAFSQYPRPGETPTRHPNSDKPKLRDIRIMGYSMRTKRHRYTEWIEWNPLAMSGNWSNVRGVELYDHVIDPGENLNIANRPALRDLRRTLQTELRTQFSIQ